MANDKQAANDETQAPEAPAPLSVFITGGTTGVGLSLARMLVRQGVRVTAATNAGSDGAYTLRAVGVTPVFPDMKRVSEVRSLLQMAGVDVVVHLSPTLLNEAPQCSMNYEGHLDDLIAEASVVAEAAASANVRRVIMASAAFVYGDQDGAVVDESAHLHPFNPLYKAMLKAEKAMLSSGIASYVLRAGFIYGGSSTGLQAIAELLKRGRTVMSGLGHAGWIHEDDLASATALLVTKPFEDADASKIYNVVDDSPVTANAFMDAFGEAFGVGAPSKAAGMLDRWTVSKIQRELLHDSAQPSNARIRAELGWAPQYAELARGIERMLMSWRAAEAVPQTAPQEG